MKKITTMARIRDTTKKNSGYVLKIQLKGAKILVLSLVKFSRYIENKRRITK